jgi:glycine oxidase
MTVGRAIWPDQLTEAERACLSPGTPEGLDREPDVLIVGGGIIGCATAAACQRAGLGSVVVLERDKLGVGASGGAAGLLMPEAHAGLDPEPFVDAMRLSLEAWRRLDSTWTGGVGLLPHQWHGQPQARVNPLRAIARLASELRGIASGVQVNGMDCADGRLQVVHTSAGEFRPRNVVLATGTPPPLLGLESVPAGEVKGHMLCTAPTGLTTPANLDVCSVIEDGRLLVGGTLDVGETERRVRPEVIDSMWSDVVAAWPAANGVRVEYTWACFRPAHPDHLPVIDRVPGLSNVWLTSGHYKTGILMAPASGSALAAWILDGAPPAWVSPFTLKRLLTG